MPTPDGSEPTVRVPMTERQVGTLHTVLLCLRGDHLEPMRADVRAMLAAYDAAVARPADAGRTVRWCETHGRVAKLGDGCGPRWADELEPCRVSTRTVGGAVADG